MADTLEQEQAEHAETKKLLADVMGDGGSFRRLQEDLDNQLALNREREEARSKTVSELINRHTTELESLKNSHEKIVYSLNASHAAALVDQENQLRAEHAKELAELKENTLVPALADYHARQRADLEAAYKKQSDELAAAHAAQLELVK